MTWNFFEAVAGLLLAVPMGYVILNAFHGRRLEKHAELPKNAHKKKILYQKARTKHIQASLFKLLPLISLAAGVVLEIAIGMRKLIQAWP